MSALVAVLDANVLVPAVLRDTLLTLAAAGVYEGRWSEMILAETQRALREIIGPERAARVDLAVRRRFPQALVVGFESLIDAMPARDPNDRHVIAAAVECGAQVIVTQNVRDFPAAALAPFGLRVQSADDFLCAVLVSDPDGVMRSIEEQAARLIAPRLSVDQVLENLTPYAPRFVEAVRLARR